MTHPNRHGSIKISCLDQNRIGINTRETRGLISLSYFWYIYACFKAKHCLEKMMEMIRCARLAVCSVALLPVSLFAQTHPEKVLAPVINVGDRWTFQYTDNWTGNSGSLTTQEVVELSGQEVSLEAKRASNGRLVSRLRFSSEMNPIKRGNMQFMPFYPRYSFPLEVGKVWEQEVVGENSADRKAWRYQVKGKVVGWEKVTVQAGQFEALKVEIEARYQGRDVFSSGGGHLNETVWYAPAVNNFVKQEYQDTDWRNTVFNRSTWELTAFNVKQPSVRKEGD